MCGGEYTRVKNYHTEFNYGEITVTKSKVGFYLSIHLHILKEGETRRLSRGHGLRKFPQHDH